MGLLRGFSRYVHGYFALEAFPGAVARASSSVTREVLGRIAACCSIHGPPRALDCAAIVMSVHAALFLRVISIDRHFLGLTLATAAADPSARVAGPDFC